ncbi:MAG: hypothetical protein Q4C78_01825 [Synergistaceae bacterium]|nr:hypothetical protein [Synergistaceae bacterium]
MGTKQNRNMEVQETYKSVTNTVIATVTPPPHYVLTFQETTIKSIAKLYLCPDNDTRHRNFV